MDAITSFLRRSYEQGATYSSFAHLDEDAVKFYRLFVTKKCFISSKLVLYWRRGTDFGKLNATHSKVKNFNGCPISVGSFEYQPKMIIEEKENGSLAIAGGLDGMLVLLIAERLNFSIELKSPSVSDEESNYSQKLALVRDVASGFVEFAVSRSNPTNAQEISQAYDEECLTWAVPRISSRWANLVWTEFHWRVWILVASVFVCSCIFGYVHYSITLSRNANRGGVGFITIMIDILSINLGNPVVRVPVSMGGKFMLMASLYYAVVTTTAYKSSLASILTTIKSVPMATDAEGILEAGLKVGGSAYHYNILKKQANDSEVDAKIIKRYVIYAKDLDALLRVGHHNDFALLARRSTLNFAKHMTVRGGRLIKFDILDGCVLAYPTTMMFRKGSFLLEPINNIIEHLRESGILKYWDHIHDADNSILERKNVDKFSAVLMGKKYSNVFMFYIGCILVCILVFFIEILVGRFGPKKRRIVVRCGRFMRQ